VVGLELDLAVLLWADPRSFGTGGAVS